MLNSSSTGNAGEKEKSPPNMTDASRKKPSRGKKITQGSKH